MSASVLTVEETRTDLIPDLEAVAIKFVEDWMAGVNRYYSWHKQTILIGDPTEKERKEASAAVAWLLVSLGIGD